MDDKQLDDYDNFTPEMWWKTVIIPYFVAFIFFCDVMGRYWLYTQCKTGADFFRNPFNVADFSLVMLDVGMALIELLTLISPGDPEMLCAEFVPTPIGPSPAPTLLSESLMVFCGNTHAINATDKATDGCDSYWMDGSTTDYSTSYRECEALLMDTPLTLIQEDYNCASNPMRCGCAERLRVAPLSASSALHPP